MSRKGFIHALVRVISVEARLRKAWEKGSRTHGPTLCSGVEGCSPSPLSNRVSGQLNAKEFNVKAEGGAFH